MAGNFYQHLCRFLDRRIYSSHTGFMEEKKVQQEHYPIRPFPGFRDTPQLISRKFSFRKIYPCVFLKNENGFTKIEIFIGLGLFITVMVILFNITHPVEQIRSVHDSKRKTDLKALQHLLNDYYEKNNRYPDASLDYHIMAGKTSLAWGKDGFIPYTSVLPDDPTPFARQYVYYTDSSNQSYWVYASLERGSQDVDSCGSACSLGDGRIPSSACGTTGSSAVCNFGVSSPNVSP